MNVPVAYDSELAEVFDSRAVKLESAVSLHANLRHPYTVRGTYADLRIVEHVRPCPPFTSFVPATIAWVMSCVSMTTSVMKSLSPCCRSFPVPVLVKCTSGLTTTQIASEEKKENQSVAT